MEEKGQDGATSPSMEQRIGGVQRQELLAKALREDDTPVPAISIHTNMNIEGQPEHFDRQTLQGAESAAGSSAGGGAATTCSMSFSSGTIWASHICLQQEQYNSQKRLQQEQHQRGQGEIVTVRTRWQLIQT